MFSVASESSSREFSSKPVRIQCVVGRVPRARIDVHQVGNEQLKQVFK